MGAGFRRWRSRRCRGGGGAPSSSRARSKRRGFARDLLRELRRRARALRGARARDRADPDRHGDREPLRPPPPRLRADRFPRARALGGPFPLRRGREPRRDEPPPRPRHREAPRRRARLRRALPRGAPAGRAAAGRARRRCARKMVALAGEIAEGVVFANVARSHLPASLAALPAAKRADPAFFVGNMIPTCIAEDRAAAAAVNRRTLAFYLMLPELPARLEGSRLRRGDGRRREGPRPGRAREDRRDPRRALARGLLRSTAAPPRCARASTPGAPPGCAPRSWCRPPPPATSSRPSRSCSRPSPDPRCRPGVPRLELRALRGARGRGSARAARALEAVT